VHDIRRTVSTNLNESRLRVTKKQGLELREYYSFAKPHVVEAILNHVSGHKRGETGRYNYAEYLPEMRDAQEQWAAYLLALPSSARQTPSENAGETDGQAETGTRG
jgi:hypothetical protein